MVTSSARKRFDLATKLGSGNWISQGSYPTLEAAQKRGEQWLAAAGSTGEYRIRNEIGNEVYSKHG